MDSASMSIKTWIVSNDFASNPLAQNGGVSMLH